jgi:hypothetical protein
MSAYEFNFKDFSKLKSSYDELAHISKVGRKSFLRVNPSASLSGKAHAI